MGTPMEGAAGPNVATHLTLIPVKFAASKYVVCGHCSSASTHTKRRGLFAEPFNNTKTLVYGQFAGSGNGQKLWQSCVGTKIRCATRCLLASCINMLALFTTSLRRFLGHYWLVFSCSLLLVAVCAGSPAGAESKASVSGTQSAQINRVLGELEKVRNLQQAAISPDGSLLAWVVDGEHGGSEIELAPRKEPQKTHRITAGEKGSGLRGERAGLVAAGQCAGVPLGLPVARAVGGVPLRSELEDCSEAHASARLCGSSAVFAGWAADRVPVCRGRDAALGRTGSDEAAFGRDWPGWAGNSTGRSSRVGRRAGPADQPGEPSRV